MLTKTLKECFLSISVVLIVSILLPALPFVIIPLYALRQIVKLLAKILNPDLGEMLSGHTAGMVSRGVYCKPHNNNKSCSGVISFVLIDTEINIDLVQEIGLMVIEDERFIKAKMIVVKWMGFYFWKLVKSFNLRSQLILHEEPITEKEFQTLTETKFNDEPYTKGKPLWEIHLFSNYIPTEQQSSTSKNTITKYSAVACKTHHCILDWVSGANLIERINHCLAKRNLLPPESNYQKELKLEEPKNQEEGSYKNKFNLFRKIKTIVFLLRLLVLGPFQLVRELIVSSNTAIKHFTPGKPLKEYQSFQVGVPLEYLRAISKKHGVSTPTLIFTGLTGALRQLLIDLNGEDALPDTVSLTMALPLPWSRPKDLGNYLMLGFAHAAVGEEDLFKRLELTKNEFHRLRTSTVHLALHSFYSFFGGLPYKMMEPFINYKFGAINCSFGPGNHDLKKSIGLNIKNFFTSGGVPFGDAVMLGFVIYIINGQVKISVTGDKALFPQPSSSKRLLDVLLKECDFFNEKN